MFYHLELANTSFAQNRKLQLLIEQGRITLGGNKRLKIYGTLHCKSGIKMKIENRVFFISEEEAIAHNYRPCGHCLRIQYQKFKKNTF